VRPTVVDGDADTFGRLAESPVARPDASIVGEPSRCEELSVDITNAATDQVVPVDELEGFQPAWRLWPGAAAR
jgi:hypothetical protein